MIHLSLLLFNLKVPIVIITSTRNMRPELDPGLHSFYTGREADWVNRISEEKYSERRQSESVGIRPGPRRGLHLQRHHFQRQVGEINMSL